MKIGNYKIVETIKAGSFFKVYKAIQLPFERHVFLKEAKMSLPDNIIERFEREAQIAAFLNHPNIVKIYETFTKKDSVYHAFEWVDGIDLSKIMEFYGKIPEEIGLLIVYEVLKALDYAHSRGIVHRDIKPSNIMISRDGFVKLTDFGVAKWEDLPEITQPGVVIGTPHYLSPEQVKGEKPIPASDIFSLGIVLYEMIFGEKPFKGEDTTSILLKIEKGVFQIPKGLERKRKKVLKIIKKSLEKEKDKRYKSAKEMMRDIENILGEKKIIKSQEVLSQFLVSALEVATTRTMERKEELIVTGRKKYTYIFALPISTLLILLFSLFLYFRIFFVDVHLKIKGFKNPHVKIENFLSIKKEEAKIFSFPPGRYRIVCEDKKRFFLKDFEISKKNSEVFIEDTLPDSTIYVKGNGEIFLNSEIKDTFEYKGKSEGIPYLVEIRKNGDVIFRELISRKSKIYIDVKESRKSHSFINNLRIFFIKIFNL